MPKVRPLPLPSPFTSRLISRSVCVFLGVSTLACNQTKQQELNPPQQDSTIAAPDKGMSGGLHSEIHATTEASATTQKQIETPAPIEPATLPVPVNPPLEPAPSVPIPGPAQGPKPGVTPLPMTTPTSEPATVPATNPASTDSGGPRPAGNSFTGTLHGGVIAAGSETTGWALHVDGSTDGLIIDVTAISGEVKALDGRHVTITGQLKEKNWPALSPPNGPALSPPNGPALSARNGAERGKTQLLVAETIAVTPLPDMNK
jgi:hypothetical protein